MNSYAPGVTWFDENTGDQMFGTIINTAYCNVTGTWSMLVCSESGIFRSINPESYGVNAITMVYSESDDDDDAENDV
jgi:hypothetical protein